MPLVALDKNYPLLNDQIVMNDDVDIVLDVQVADIQLQSSGLEVQNSNLKLQLAQCQSNNSHATDESRRRLQDNQQAHDKQVGVCSCLPVCPLSCQSHC